MKESEIIKVDETWTIFLDRDGVINKKIENGYVKSYEDFIFLDSAIKGIALLSSIFSRIIIVTNQRGIGKGLMKLEKLISIHEKMKKEIKKRSGRIDGIYYCPDISDNSELRKPNIGMALKAKKDFPQINFEKSFIIGDSISDMSFGNKLRMKCIFISSDENLDSKKIYDFKFKSLYESAIFLKKLI